MDTIMIEVKGFLTNTAVNKDHHRSKELEVTVNEMAGAFGGSIDEFNVVKGNSTFRVKGEGVGDKIVAEFKKIDGVDARTLSPLAVYRQRNLDDQKRAESKKAKKASKQ